MSSVRTTSASPVVNYSVGTGLDAIGPSNTDWGKVARDNAGLYRLDTGASVGTTPLGAGQGNLAFAPAGQGAGGGSSSATGSYGNGASQYEGLFTRKLLTGEVQKALQSPLPGVGNSQPNNAATSLSFTPLPSGAPLTPLTAFTPDNPLYGSNNTSSTAAPQQLSFTTPSALPSTLYSYGNAAPVNRGTTLQSDINALLEKTGTTPKPLGGASSSLSNFFVTPAVLTDSRIASDPTMPNPNGMLERHNKGGVLVAGPLTDLGRGALNLLPRPVQNGLRNLGVVKNVKKATQGADSLLQKTSVGGSYRSTVTPSPVYPRTPLPSSSGRSSGSHGSSRSAGSGNTPQRTQPNYGSQFEPLLRQNGIPARRSVDKPLTPAQIKAKQAQVEYASYTEAKASGRQAWLTSSNGKRMAVYYNEAKEPIGVAGPDGYKALPRDVKTNNHVKFFISQQQSNTYAPVGRSGSNKPVPAQSSNASEKVNYNTAKPSASPWKSLNDNPIANTFQRLIWPDAPSTRNYSKLNEGDLNNPLTTEFARGAIAANEKRLAQEAAQQQFSGNPFEVLYKNDMLPRTEWTGYGPAAWITKQTYKKPQITPSASQSETWIGKPTSALHSGVTFDVAENSKEHQFAQDLAKKGLVGLRASNETIGLFNSPAVTVTVPNGDQGAGLQAQIKGSTADQRQFLRAPDGANPQYQATIKFKNASELGGLMQDLTEGRHVESFGQLGRRNPANPQARDTAPVRPGTPANRAVVQVPGVTVPENNPSGRVSSEPDVFTSPMQVETPVSRPRSAPTVEPPNYRVPEPAGETVSIRLDPSSGRYVAEPITNEVAPDYRGKPSEPIATKLPQVSFSSPYQPSSLPGSGVRTYTLGKGDDGPIGSSTLGGGPKPTPKPAVAQTPSNPVVSGPPSIVDRLSGLGGPTAADFGFLHVDHPDAQYGFPQSGNVSPQKLLPGSNSYTPIISSPKVSKNGDVSPPTVRDLDVYFEGNLPEPFVQKLVDANLAYNPRTNIADASRLADAFRTGRVITVEGRSPTYPLGGKPDGIAAAVVTPNHNPIQAHTGDLGRNTAYLSNLFSGNLPGGGGTVTDAALAQAKAMGQDYLVGYTQGLPALDLYVGKGAIITKVVPNSSKLREKISENREARATDPAIVDIEASLPETVTDAMKSSDPDFELRNLVAWHPKDILAISELAPAVDYHFKFPLQEQNPAVGTAPTRIGSNSLASSLSSTPLLSDLANGAPLAGGITASLGDSSLGRTLVFETTAQGAKNLSQFAGQKLASQIAPVLIDTGLPAPGAKPLNGGMGPIAGRSQDTSPGNGAQFGFTPDIEIAGYGAPGQAGGRLPAFDFSREKQIFQNGVRDYLLKPALENVLAPVEVFKGVSSPKATPFSQTKPIPSAIVDQPGGSVLRPNSPLDTPTAQPLMQRTGTPATYGVEPTGFINPQFDIKLFPDSPFGPRSTNYRVKGVPGYFQRDPSFNLFNDTIMGRVVQPVASGIGQVGGVVVDVGKQVAQKGTMFGVGGVVAGIVDIGFNGARLTPNSLYAQSMLNLKPTASALTVSAKHVPVSITFYGDPNTVIRESWLPGQDPQGKGPARLDTNGALTRGMLTSTGKATEWGAAVVVGGANLGWVAQGSFTPANVGINPAKINFSRTGSGDPVSGGALAAAGGPQINFTNGVNLGPIRAVSTRFVGPINVAGEISTDPTLPKSGIPMAHSPVRAAFGGPQSFMSNTSVVSTNPAFKGEWNVANWLGDLFQPIPSKQYESKTFDAYNGLLKPLKTR